MRAVGLIATLAAAAAASLTTAAPAAHSPVCGNGKTTVLRDPRRLRPLDPSPLEKAMAAAAKFEPARLKPLPVGASLAVVDPRRGPAVKKECGARVWQRTAIVYMTLRALPPKRSQSILYVGRFPSGYRVWKVVR